jgi:multidrug resistance protein, MATE family
LGGTFCVELALLAAIAIMMGTLGTASLAAYQIAFQYLTIALPIIFALGQTVTIRIGNEVGRNSRDSANLAGFVNIGMSFCLVLLFSMFYWCFPHLAISFDLNLHDPELQTTIAIATKFLALAGISILVDSIRMVTQNALRALKDTKIPMYISILGFWCVAFTSAYLLSFKFHFGGVGIWWGFIFGLSVAGIITFIRFNYLIRRVDLTAMVTRVDN